MNKNGSVMKTTVNNTNNKKLQTSSLSIKQSSIIEEKSIKNLPTKDTNPTETGTSNTGGYAEGKKKIFISCFEYLYLL